MREANLQFTWGQIQEDPATLRIDAAIPNSANCADGWVLPQHKLELAY